MFIKNINNINQKKSYLHKLLALSFLFLITSCKDYGCIDADDFGEYETYTFKVESSRINEYCSYKQNSAESDQPVGIKQCYIDDACNSKPMDEKNECGEACEDKCRLNPQKSISEYLPPSLDLNTTEPLWTSIGGGGENNLSIEHNSKILITAQGKINLGSEIQKSTVFIDKDNVGKEEWKNLDTKRDIAKFSGKENIILNIDGKFNDETNQYFTTTPNNNDPDNIEFNKINYYNRDIANGARRIFAYFIPSPDPKEYDKFPIAPDPSTSICSITNGYYACSQKDKCKAEAKLECDEYSTVYKTDIAEDKKNDYNHHFSKIFDIDNLSKESSRHEGGSGFIRYQGDNLIQTENTNDVTATNSQTLDVSTLLKSLNFPNLQKDYAIKFKNTGDSRDTNCRDLKYTVDDPSNPNPNFYTIDFDKTYEINKADLKKFQYQADRDCKVNVFFYPFQELEFEQSGYIEFGIPTKSKSTVAVNCNLKFKIFHKNTQKDEFANFTYPSSTSSTKYRDAVEANTAAHSITNGAKKYFIRKGQILSFHPDSWNGTWTPKYPDTSPPTPPAPQECGVGFYVKLTPRPAVFCSNKLVKEFMNINEDIDRDNNCSNLYYDESIDKHIGCQEDRSKCVDDKYCPNECIPKDFNSCRANSSPSNPTTFYSPSTSCNPANPEYICYDGQTPAECIPTSEARTCKLFTEFNDPNDASRNIKESCEKCKQQLKQDATTAFFKKTDIPLQQCYDLENYTGTMEELRIKLDILNEDNTLGAFQILEGLKKLETFDGNYGNFHPLRYTDKINPATGIPIYKLKNSIQIARPGYLKFIILDDIPTNQNNPDYFEILSSARLGISMPSPLRINIKSSNELTNGEGLTIALCKEIDENNECAGIKSLVDQKNSFSITPANVLPISEYDTEGSFLSESNYRFNDFGQLIRDKDMDPNLEIFSNKYKRECTASEDIKPSIGTNFLCFRDQENTQNENPSDNNSYRLTFKIFDNETPTCKEYGNTYKDCNPTGPPPDSNCTKFKRLNKNFNGAENGSFCDKNADEKCQKNFRCVDDKYANNEGHYDVAVKIRKDSKVKVSNFIDSIISPILGQVDGFYQTDKIDHTNLENFIKDFSEKTIRNPTKNTPADNSLTPVILEINDKDCEKNCIITDITKATLTYEPATCPIQNIWSNLKEKCVGFTRCSIFVGKSAIQYENGTQLFPIPPNCKIEKIDIEFKYKKSIKTLFKENQVRRIYKSILVNPVYKSFLTLSIVLMFSFYGMGFLMGVSELKQSEIVDRLIKVGLIYLFTNPNFGWVWFEKFFVTFFKNGVDFLTFTMAGLFDETNQINSALKTGNFSNKSLIFAGVDRVIQLFLINDVIHKKIGALLFYNFFGILYVMIIYYSAIAYVYAISNAVLIYLTSQFFTSVLFLVGPIFFVFILFNQTKGFFDNWLNALIGFALQQIFLVFTLSLFNTMLYLVIKLTLGFRVCWDSVWQINSPGLKISLLSFWTPQDAPPYLGEISNPSVNNSSSTLVPTIPRLLSLWTICVIMKSFITTITSLASLLSGGISATDLGESVAKGMNKMIDQTQKQWNTLYKKSGANIISRADEKLFNSGELAKQARKKAKNAESSNNKVKDRMKKDGDKAVSDFKIKNANEYAKMSEADKRKTLSDVKQKAMRESAKSMGKTNKEIDNLMKDKSGSKYQGDNVFGAMMSIGKDRFKNMSLNNASFSRKSLNDKTIEFDTGMSQKEMDKAMKGMGDSDKRNEFIENVKGGNIEKTPGLLERLNPMNIRKETKEKAEERQIAINQLEKSGDIPRLASTFDPKNPHRSFKDKVVFALKNPQKSIPAAFSERSKSAEEKILARIKENREEKSFGGGNKDVDAKNINRLEAFAKHLEAKEGKNEIDDLAKTKKDLSEAENSPDKNKISQVEKDSNQKIIEKLKDEKSSNDTEKNDADALEKLNSSEKNYNKTLGDILGDPTHREMYNLNNKIQKGDSTSNNLKRFNELKEKDKTENQLGNRFDEKNDKRLLAKKDLVENQIKFENLNKKGENIDNALHKLESKTSSDGGNQGNPQTPPTQPRP